MWLFYLFVAENKETNKNTVPRYREQNGSCQKCVKGIKNNHIHIKFYLLFYLYLSMSSNKLTSINFNGCTTWQYVSIPWTAPPFLHCWILEMSLPILLSISNIFINCFGTIRLHFGLLPLDRFPNAEKLELNKYLYSKDLLCTVLNCFLEQLNLVTCPPAMLSKFLSYPHQIGY